MEFFTSALKKGRAGSPDFSSAAFTLRRTPPKKKKRSRSGSRSPTSKRTRRSRSRSPPSPRSPDEIAALLSDAVAQVRVASPLDLKALHAARVERNRTRKALAEALKAATPAAAQPTSPRREGESMRDFHARRFKKK